MVLLKKSPENSKQLWCGSGETLTDLWIYPLEWLARICVIDCLLG